MLDLSTRVAIIGAGPAGLVLSRLLAHQGIDSCVLERRSREYVEHRVRAGVLERPTMETLCEAGVGERLTREGIEHWGIELRFAGRAHRIDFKELAGRSITVYGQREVVRDLIAARLTAGAGEKRQLLFEVSEAALTGADSSRPVVNFSWAAEAVRLACDWVVGRDGSHGVSRQWLPEGSSKLPEHTYPFAWLGILAAVRHPRESSFMRFTSVVLLYTACALPSSPVFTCKWRTTKTWGME